MQQTCEHNYATPLLYEDGTYHCQKCKQDISDEVLRYRSEYEDYKDEEIKNLK